MWNLLSASRRSVSVSVYPVVWRLDAPLGFIWNWSRRCASRFATLSVGSMCRIASQGSSTLYIWNRCRRRDGRCRHSRRRFVSVVSCGIPRLIWWHLVSASQRLSSGLSSWVRMCHVVCHPEGHVSLNIIEKCIPKPKILTETRTQDIFRVCDLSSCNLSETNKFRLSVVLLLCLVLELHKTSSSRLEPRTDFGVVAFVSIISSSKQTALVLAPFFCRA
jgi:hypothetical protein